jgi:hypothetical protein
LAFAGRAVRWVADLAARARAANEAADRTDSMPHVIGERPALSHKWPNVVMATVANRIWLRVRLGGLPSSGCTELAFSAPFSEFFIGLQPIK